MIFSQTVLNKCMFRKQRGPRYIWRSRWRAVSMQHRHQSIDQRFLRSFSGMRRAFLDPSLPWYPLICLPSRRYTPNCLGQRYRAAESVVGSPVKGSKPQINGDTRHFGTHVRTVMPSCASIISNAEVRLLLPREEVVKANPVCGCGKSWWYVSQHIRFTFHISKVDN